MARLALLGYGKMGKAIEQEAMPRGHQIIARVDQDTPGEWEKLQAESVDVVIEFTHPDSFFSNLERLLPLGIPIVSGTTGWYTQMEEVRSKVEEAGASFLYAANFSVGVNILFQLNKRLAKLMNGYPDYDCFVEERHHRFKADGPSGTAVFLGKQILEELDRKDQLSDATLRTRPPKAEELSMGFVRAGNIFGMHEVGYTSEIDSIHIRHTAHNRRGFALGAVIAAEWMRDKRGFFEFSTLFEEHEA